MINKCCPQCGPQYRESTEFNCPLSQHGWNYVVNHLVSLCQKRSSWHVEKTHQIMWYSLLDYGRLEWQPSLRDLDEVVDVAYQDVLDEFDSMWCIEGLIVTQSNLTVTWKVRVPEEHCFSILRSLGLIFPRVLYLLLLQLNLFQLVPKTK